MLHRFSDDDGISWSEPADITASTMPYYRNVFALGPGHGICTPNGTLLVPIWMVPRHYESPLDKHGPSVIGTLYSTDCGESWKTGDILPTTYDILSPNETSPCLLSDGRVYLNIRTTCNYRAMAISRTGYDGWTNYVPDKRLIDPCCFGSCAHYSDGRNPHTVLFANCESKTSRKNVVIKASVSDTVNWEYRRVIDEVRGGYVETAVDSAGGFIYVLYENNYGESDHLARFDYEWLTTGKQ